MTIAYQPGEIVRAAITTPVVLDPAKGPAIEIAAPDRRVTIALSTPGLTVERIAPAQDPRPGEIWRTADGDLWLAQKYWPNYTDDEDARGINTEGWRIRMIPLDGGDSIYRPEDLHQQHILVARVHRQPMCECPVPDPWQPPAHVRSCPQRPICDCPVDDQDVSHHLPDCGLGGEER